MKRVAIITVAGASTRFRKSIGRDCLKCIYTEKTERQTLLYKLVSLCAEFDEIIIVGGYLFDELKDFLKTFLSEFSKKIKLVKNEHYDDFGSGYSLYLGINEVEMNNCGEILFTEGDLFFDKNSFTKILNSPYSIITTNSEAIEAKKAVAFYTTDHNEIRYIYDTSHNLLSVSEPFLGIYNSGQVWKFFEPQKLFAVVDTLSEKEKAGTNLVIIQKYFDLIPDEKRKIIHFEKWINCNTVDDYRKMMEE